MCEAVIKVESIFKKYRFNADCGPHSRRSLTDLLKINFNNADRYFDALKDISFEVTKGEVLGIVGKNGAGKSTLLKILSRITAPTSGSVHLKGSVASLLEVGTGFHPELTGKENVFMNGAILGMSKSEIQRRYDEIVEFSGIEKFINTPVKRYSSGMYVRLAFAVAAHLDADTLIIDEVLAVGDLEFQKRCLGKMKDITQQNSRTVLFVSHNIDVVSKLCDQCILLRNGALLAKGATSDVIHEYVSEHFVLNKWKRSDEDVSIISSIEVDRDFLLKGEFRCCISFQSAKIIRQLNVGLIVKTITGRAVFGTNFDLHPTLDVRKNICEGQANVFIEDVPIHSGMYSVDVYVYDGYDKLDAKTDVIKFEFVSANSNKQNFNLDFLGPLNIKARWELKPGL